MTPEIFPAYFFSGPELGQKRTRIKAIHDALASLDGQAPEMHRYYPYDTPSGEIVSLLRSGSLFSARRLIEVADAHTVKAADIKIFRGYLKSPSPESVLIFTTDSGPGSREYPRTLAEALHEDAVKVFWEMFETDKRKWVQKFFREKGVKADWAAVSLLLDITEGTTDFLREACELLSFTAEKGTILGEDDVDKVLEHSRDETVYTLFDRFCRRNLTGVLEAYRKMCQSDPGSVDRVLMALADPLVMLRDFKAKLAQGFSAAKAAGELKLRGGKRAQKSYAEGANNFAGVELDAAIRRLIDLEAWLRDAPRDLRIPKTEIWFCRVLGR